MCVFTYISIFMSFCFLLLLVLLVCMECGQLSKSFVKRLSLSLCCSGCGTATTSHSVLQQASKICMCVCVCLRTFPYLCLFVFCYLCYLYMCCVDNNKARITESLIVYYSVKIFCETSLSLSAAAVLVVGLLLLLTPFFNKLAKYVCVISIFMSFCFLQLTCVLVYLLVLRVYMCIYVCIMNRRMI